MIRNDIQADRAAFKPAKAATSPRSKSPSAYGGVGAFRDLYAPPLESQEAQFPGAQAPESAPRPQPARPPRLRQTLSGTVVCLLLVASASLLWANNALFAQMYGEFAGQPVQAASRPATSSAITQVAPAGGVAAPTGVLTQTLAIVLDSSSRMLQPADNSDQTRWSIARTALDTTLNSDTIPSNALLTISAFGQDGTGCTDHAMLQYPELFSFERAYNAMYDARPGPDGVVPLDGALWRTTAQMAAATGPATIVLITGGGDTCGGNSVATAAEWSTSSTRQIMVVAVSPHNDDERNELRAIASAGHGEYFEVSSSDAVADVLRLAIGTEAD